MKHFVWLALLSSVTLFAQDPPSRVARLNLLQGPVSFQPGTLDEWAPASRNYPLTTGDRLYTEDRSRAELQIGSASVRLDGRTNFSILNLDDATMQVGITSGAISVRVRSMLGDDVYEVDTPNGAVSLMGRGEYRIDCDPDRNSTVVTVRSGEAELIANGQTFPVHQGETGYFDEGTQQLEAASPPDSFDRFTYARDRREDVAPPPYISRDMIGWEDLNDNGDWRNVPEYGNVWTPRVPVGWAPYRDGHWAWVAPWGWTWVDDEPWGFAPFHYGRWAYMSDSWGWIPGPVAVRPVYAPALVAFIGGGNFGLSLSFGGGGGGVGWFPLGPRDVYVPSYYASNNYVNRVNITNVRNMNAANINYVRNNITNVNMVRNITYANQQVPGAVTAISRNDFVSARPVRQSAISIPVQSIARAPIMTNATVAPQRSSVLAAQGPVNVARPPSAIYTRPVVARVAPPPPPVSFVTAQRVQAPIPGRAPDPVALRQLQQQTPPARQVFVRPAITPGAGIQARPGQFQPATNPRAVSGQGQPQIAPQRMPQQVPQGQQRPAVVPPPQSEQQRIQQMQQQRQMQQYPAQQPQVQQEQQRQLQMERQRQIQQGPPARVQQDQEQQRQLQMERQRQIQLEQQQRQNQQGPPPQVQQDQQQQRQLQMERQRQIQAEQQQRRMQQAPSRQQQQAAPPPRQQPERRPPPPRKKDEKKPPADK